MKDKSNKNPVIQSMLKHLAEETIPPEKMDLWPALKTNLAASRNLLQIKESSVNKRFIFTALTAVCVLAIVAIVAANAVTTVSAKEVLDRAYYAQSQSAPAEGISHIRSEIYTNIEAKEQGMETIVESYSDPVSGSFRVVTIDKASGKVLQVNAFDGSHAYSSDNLQGSQEGDAPLTVYRNPQDQNSLYLKKFAKGMDQKLNPGLNTDAKIMFDKMRNDPAVELLDQETWDNTCTSPNAVQGSNCEHTVYALRSQQEIKLMVDNEITHPIGWVTFYFDTETYQLLGNRVTMERDGQEVVINLQRVVVDEVLPEESNIAWDLSDLPGLNIVDDPNGEFSRFGNKHKNIISVEDLASKTDSAYLLETLPESFSLEIGVMPQQPENEQFFYEASYTNQDGDTFIIRALGKPLDDIKQNDTYTTASGLVLHFPNKPTDTSEDGSVPTVLIEAPNGKTYAIDSTLPRESIQALAEELVLVK